MDKSFFVSDAPIPREVTLPDGSTHVLYFKELAMVEFAAYQEARSSNDADTRHASLAKLIAMSVMEPSQFAPGEFVQSMTEAEARKLTKEGANALVGVILQINGFGGEEKKE